MRARLAALLALLWVGSLAQPLAVPPAQGSHVITHIVRDGWDVNWNVTANDGINLYNVTFNGTPVLEDARLPGVLVTYVGAVCFFYDELLSGWIIQPAHIYVEDSPLGGFRIRADYDVPGYLYQQIWEFLPDGTFLGLLEIGGGGCNASHTYQTRWRYDFSLGGNNTISEYNGTAWNSVSQESELTDSGARDPSRIDTIWETSGEQGSYSIVPIDTPEEPATARRFLALRDRMGEIENSHTPGVVTPYTYLNGEALTGSDTAFWYISEHFHNITEGTYFQEPVYTGLVFYPNAGQVPTFRMSADPGSLTTPPGDSANSTITLSSLAGFAGNITLASNDPSGFLSQSSAVLGANETLNLTLTVAISNTTLPGTFAITVLGNSSLVHRWAIVSITVPSVLPPPPEPSSYTRFVVPHKFVGGGTPQNFQEDDFSWPVNLNFTFPFYGGQYTSIWVSSNGLITFSGPDSSYFNSISALAQKSAIAVLWDDLETTNRTGADIYMSSPDPDHIVIRWQALTYQTLYEVDFEVILGRDGTIQLNYGPATGLVSATVGISDGTGDTIAEEITNSSLIQSIIFKLSTEPDFILTAGPNSLTLEVGESAQSIVTVMSVRNFTGEISLTAVADSSASFSPSVSLNSSLVTLESNQTAAVTLTISTVSSTAPGSYVVMVTGTNGTASRSATVSVSVTPKGLLSFHDDFDYLNIDEMQNAGWVVCGSAPLSYYYFSNGVLALENNGTAGGTVCWNNTLEGVSDWTVATSLKWFANTGGSLGLVVSTTQHSYLWQADGSSGMFELERDGQSQPATLAFPGYVPMLDVWHEMRLDMRSGALYMFFDGQLVGTYEEINPGNLTQVGLPSQRLAHNAFDFVEVRQLQPVPYFRAGASSPTLTLKAGTTSVSSVTLTSVNGFVGDVSLTVVFSPGVFNASARFDPKSVGLGSIGTAASTLTISAGNTAPPGTYTLAVTATSGSLSRSIPITVTITPPNRSPVSQFTYAPSDSRTGDLVTFDASASIDSDGVIVQYSWDFGDGSPIVTTTDPVAFHVYAEAGSWTVALTVTDDNGTTATTSTTMIVEAPPAGAGTLLTDYLFYGLVATTIVSVLTVVFLTRYRRRATAGATTSG